MTTKVHAIFRNGVFQPTVPPSLADGTVVELTVTTSEGPRSLADELEKIARLPVEVPVVRKINQVDNEATWADIFRDVIGRADGLPDDSSVNHDHYLYGADKK